MRVTLEIFRSICYPNRHESIKYQQFREGIPNQSSPKPLSLHSKRDFASSNPLPSTSTVPSDLSWLLVVTWLEKSNCCISLVTSEDTKRFVILILFTNLNINVMKWPSLVQRTWMTHERFEISKRSKFYSTNHLVAGTYNSQSYRQTILRWYLRRESFHRVGTAVDNLITCSYNHSDNANPNAKYQWKGVGINCTMDLFLFRACPADQLCLPQ